MKWTNHLWNKEEKNEISLIFNWANVNLFLIARMKKQSLLGTGLGWFNIFLFLFAIGTIRYWKCLYCIVFVSLHYRYRVSRISFSIVFSIYRWCAKELKPTQQLKVLLCWWQCDVTTICHTFSSQELIEHRSRFNQRRVKI